MSKTAVLTPDAPASAPAARGRPRSAEVDRAILEAAVDELCEHGYDGMTMHAVAHRAGVSSASLYRRFHDKEELVVAAIEQVSDRPELPDTGSLVDDLRDILANTARGLTERGGDVLRAMLSVTGDHPKLTQLLRERMIDPRREELRHVFERAVARGEIPGAEEFSLVASMMFGPLYHRVLITDEALTPDLIDRVATLVVGALRSA
jgi:AcrR family transcriptional regulator